MINVRGYYRNLGSLRYGTSTASKTLVWDKQFFLFNWCLFIIMQWNCTSIGSCSTKKTNQWLSCSARAYGYTARQNGQGVWLYKLRNRISDFFERSYWGVQLIARPGTQYSFHISGNRGYDSNQVHSLSIFHSYYVEDVCMGTSTIM